MAAKKATAKKTTGARTTAPSARSPTRVGASKPAASAGAEAAARESCRAGSTAPRSSKSAAKASRASQPKLLSGGNPQIARGDGRAPVDAYIAAMPGWKRAVGARIDALVEQAVPGVRRAVKWNSPFYGVAGHGWFAALHCFERYVKIAFFRGDRLVPQPPVASKCDGVRYLHVHDDGVIDEALLARWLRDASRLPGGDGLGPC